MTKHDWVTGLLSEIELYCIANKLYGVAAAVSAATSVAAVDLNTLEIPGNVVYISEYIDKKYLSDCENIVRAYAGNIEEMLLRD